MVAGWREIETGQPIIETAGVEEADKRTREKPGRRKRRTERRKEDSKDGWK